MVLLGGLEFVAAGYVLNEMHKNNKKSTENSHSSSDPNRRKKKHRPDHEHGHDRPSRPPTSNLAVPGAMGRPSSAPPPQSRPQMMMGPGPQGPYYHPPAHEVMQYPPNPRPQPPPQGMPQMRPPQTQSWPVNMPSQARPPTNTEAAQYFNGPRPQQPGPWPMPGNLQQNPTMNFDTKTGKWQSGMLPTKAQAAAGNRNLSNVDLPGGGGRSVSPLVHDAITGMRGDKGRERKGSYSSVSSASSGSSGDDLAYGKDYGKRRQPTRVMSAERERPRMTPQVRVGQAPVELDWYATQTQSKKASAMAGVAAQVMNRDGLGLPSQGMYSASQPDLGVYEMDGASWGGRADPQMQVRPVEMDARETERYRAYRA